MAHGFVRFAGPTRWAKICHWQNAWFAYRFRDDELGRLVRLILEILKASHRTRAEGWSACDIALRLMLSGHVLFGQFRIRAEAFRRLADAFIADHGLHRDIWDAPQLLRTVMKRMGMAHCFEPRLEAALIAFPKCFFGKLAAAVYLWCRLMPAAYLTPEIRRAIVSRFLTDCATGVSGMWLLRMLPAARLRVTVDEGPDSSGDPKLVARIVSSEPSHFAHPALAPPGSLVNLLHRLREGDEELGLEAAANWRRGECTSTRVTELTQRTSHDGKWIAWGRGVDVTVCAMLA